MTEKQKNCKHEFKPRHTFEGISLKEDIISIPVSCVKCNIDGYSAYKYIRTILDYNPT